MKRFRVLLLCAVMVACSLSFFACGNQTSSYEYFKKNDFIESKQSDGADTIYTISSNKRINLCIGYKGSSVDTPIIISGFYYGEDDDTIFLISHIESKFRLKTSEDLKEYIEKNLTYLYKSNILYFKSSS